MALDRSDITRMMAMPSEQARQEYPKIWQAIEYIFKHYPDNKSDIAQNKIVTMALISDYSNTQIEEIIDKIATFDGHVKYAPVS
jgi:hypothetical protein